MKNEISLNSRTAREYKNISRRIVQIDSYISQGIFPTAAFLAEKIECSVRTILRDIEEMRNFYNAPIEVREGKGGYYYSEPNFFLKSVMLSEGELFSVALFDQLLEQYRNTPLESNLRSTFEKITKSLPNEVSVDSSFLKSDLTFIPEKYGFIDNDVFTKVFDALKKRATLQFDYRPLQKTTYMTRLLDPYHAVCQKGNWYIIGFVHDKNEVRVFSFARMKNVQETNEHFKIPLDFKAENYFDKEVGIWLSSKKEYNVELLISPEIGTFALNKIWHSNQEVIENKDGSVSVKFKTTQLPEIKRWILGQGKTVKVINPPELIEEIRTEIQEMRKMYE